VQVFVCIYAVVIKGDIMEIKPIGYIKSNFKTKFGVPRQAGMIDNISYIELCKEYRVADAFRGLEDFSHIWLLWEFSKCSQKQWTPTVRPPKLGGNKRMGVFSTRSPFRPNSIGLSSVKLLSIDYKCENAPLLCIEGADLIDGTPVYDIKPYLPYADCHIEATGGFADDVDKTLKNVVFKCDIPDDKYLINSIVKVLEIDPRPAYHDDQDREYGMDYGEYNIKFKVVDNVIYVTQMKHNVT
jgi:tRNA-Thr(GGU) m(6)t(6)A37 methyltransferase TsaA